MSTVRRTSLTALCACLVLLLQFIPSSADGQIIPSLSHGASISTFGNFSYGYSDWRSETIYGVTIGGYLQTSHFFGLEVRGSAFPYGALSHQYSALAGLRVAHNFARFNPYVAALGGAGHARWQGEINGHLDPNFNKSAIGPEWNIVGGVDYYAHHHFSIRLGEISYSKIYVMQNGLSPITFSGGIVYRLPFWDR